MLDSFRDAFRLPDLKRRILFTMGMLFVFRLGAHIPTPGIDSAAMAHLFEGGGVLGFLDMFAGGALRRFSIFALGVAPYINASIVMQLLVVVFPALEKMQKEGPEGQKKIIQITRLSTLGFAAIQSVGMVFWLQRVGVFSGGALGMVTAILTIIAGAVAVMWLGEEISDHGIGNGISLLIFAGIVARIPEATIRTWNMLHLGELHALIVLLALMVMIVVVAGCIVLQEGQRRLPVQYAKKVVGNKVYGGQSTFIPLKVNQGGVMPIIFASSILIFPYTVLKFFSGDMAIKLQNMLAPGSWLYSVLYVTLILFFAYFYTAMVFNPSDVANNMKKYGGFILGIRPGKPTSDYIEKVMSRITLGGALFLAIIALIPTVMTNLMGITSFYFGGTAVLIVVGVALDLVHQVEGQLLMRHYEGILKRRNGAGAGILRF
ncbi:MULTISPECIES: preprotein translocase subunit SecY [Dethiosulfovibrio]|uniref:Protein translocase subunit SecY n=2 Tax=Dethiosulfovibrio TaxID=47054 RepID=A0ABS9EJV5_9BACT|nr:MULTISPECIES: preprotein translocase subunit SecY [Dethiosulfovibrio]MCF4113026.1 preprotein translocase subunit SecY [Dethiosulfovibrio russensis]MCF4141490.1 preprotein translocase subunit SecY [Dethiosulfovibrio marinus]MCF4144446.1 preprotein translocase subunit SecY [Dethiosulfovibrio acidaminovorans]